MSFPDWVWLYFGTGGTAGALLFTLVVWYWMKVQSRVEGSMLSSVRWNMVGLMFLFLGAWFACGIGGPPGNMLSFDPAIRDLEYAYDTAMLSMFFSVPGWACILIGQRKMIQGTR